MLDTIRDSGLGQLIYFASGRRLLQYPDERSGFQIPASWTAGSTSASRASPAGSIHGELREKTNREGESPSSTLRGDEGEHGAIGAAVADEKAAKGIDKVMDPDTILVEWYGPDDQENPQNWSQLKKGYVLFALCWLTFVVYMAASVVAPGIPDMVQQYGVSHLVATLTIGLYVLGYGLGPLLFSPLSEIPSVGRLPMYLLPFALYFAVNFAAIFTPTFGGLLAARFITGFLASPALATGAGSVADLLNPLYMPLGLCLWVVAAYQGPGLGPIIVGYAVVRLETWRWSIAIHQLFSAVTLILIFVAFPETSHSNILLRRASRLRKLTGNPNYKSQGEIDQASLSKNDVFIEAIVRPFEIAIKDPSVLFAHLYISFLYAFYYLFFEAFPIIFFQIYGFGIANGELPYLSIAIGGSIFCAFYMAFYAYVVIPTVLKNGPGEPEDALLPALPASILTAASLFAIAWSAGRTHWIVPLIFTAIFAGSNFFILQPVFGYLAMSYERYAASIFAMNDAVRSTLAFAFLIAGGPMFNTLGIGPGVSLVGGLTTLCVPGIFALKFYGKRLRQRSKFASS